VGISYLFAAAMSVFPEQLTMVVFGEDYVQAAPVLRIHVWSNVFSMLGMSQSTWYVGRGLLWLGVRNTLVGASANLVLNLLVIPEYGPQGAAATTLMATALTSIVLNSLDHRTAPLAKLQMQAIALMGCWSSFRPTAPTQR
jgi:PST family polysaccharide transporter